MNMNQISKENDDILIPPEIIAAFEQQDLGYNLLVKGKAGSGKTTFAMSLMAYFTQYTPIYLSTRVAPTSIFSQFPWLKSRIAPENIIDATRTYIPPSKQTDPNGIRMKEHLMHTIRFQTIPEFLKIIYQKIEEYPDPIIIIDSWDAIIHQNFDKKTNIETLFTEFIRQTNAKLVFIAETDELTQFLEYIVDGVITLEDGTACNRTLRKFAIDKIRAVERRQKAYAYTLHKNRFRYIPPYQIQDRDNINPFIPQKDSEEYYSTGNKTLDRIYNGGLKPGTFNLLEIESSVPISTISSIFVGMLCQFITHNRGAIVNTIDGINSDLLEKKRLFLYLETESISKYLRILQPKITDHSEIRPYIRLIPDGNYNKIFFNTYTKLSSISKFQPVFSGFTYDSYRFESNLQKNMASFQNHLRLIRNSNIIELGIINSHHEGQNRPPTDTFNIDLSYVSSTHIKVIERYGSIFLYSIKPKSSCLYEMRSSFTKGFPQIKLKPIL